LEAVGRTDEAEVIVAEFEAGARRENGGRALPTPQPTSAPPPGREPIRALFRPRWRRRTVMLWIFQCLQTIGYYGFGTLVPLVLAAKGYSIVTSLTFSAVTFLGYPVGSLLSIPILERIERRTLIALAALAMVGFGLMFGYSTNTTAILIAGFCYTVASNLFSNGYHVYQSELYPTNLRATGGGTAYSLSRLATAAMPFVLLPLLDNAGPGAVFVAIAIAMGLLATEVMLLGPRSTGRALEDLTALTPTPIPRVPAQSAIGGTGLTEDDEPARGVSVTEP
jgi:putative MFS transporter